MKRLRNKWWKRNHRFQWESRKHPSFLYISVWGNTVVRRLGNYHFTLVGTTPEVLYRGTTIGALAYAKRWVLRHSDSLKG